MPLRKCRLSSGKIYHVFNKSIAGFKIFYCDDHFSRIKDVVRYYQIEKPAIRFSKFVKSKMRHDNAYAANQDKLIKIVAYCIMPTHVHFILEQLKENGISLFMRNIANSYSKFFNLRHKRNGPLWESRFKNVLVETDEQLLHLTRYVHLNPSTAYLVDNPCDWPASSYREYLGNVPHEHTACEYDELIHISPASYKEFVEGTVSYQRELSMIKHLMLD